MTSSDDFVIVVGFDGSKQSRGALESAIDEAQFRNAELRIVTVWSKASMAWYPALLETAAGKLWLKRLRSSKRRPSAQKPRGLRRA